MASAVTTERGLASAKRTMYDYDTGATTLADVAWVDMQGYDYFLVGVFRTIGTGTLVFHILANEESDGSGTDVNIKTHAFAGGQPDATGDFIWLECLAEEIRAVDSDARYVTAQISDATNSDELVVYYELGGGRQYTGLTAESIA